MVVKNDVARLWMSRDAAQSGLYTVWAGNKPEMNSTGYYYSSPQTRPPALLLVSIHASKFPWELLKLDRGEIIEVEMSIVAADRSHAVAEE